MQRYILLLLAVFIMTTGCPTEYPLLDTVVFTKADYADWTLPENQDRITGIVWITRADNQGLFNIYSEDSYNSDAGGPADTEWALGATSGHTTGDYVPWVMAVENNPTGHLNEIISMHLVTDDLWFDGKD